MSKMDTKISKSDTKKKGGERAIDSVVFRITLDRNTSEEADLYLNEIGLSKTDVVRMLFKYLAKNKKIPLSLIGHKDNSE